jgi:hypothetical protein
MINQPSDPWIHAKSYPDAKAGIQLSNSVTPDCIPGAAAAKAPTQHLVAKIAGKKSAAPARSPFLDARGTPFASRVGPCMTVLKQFRSLTGIGVVVLRRPMPDAKFFLPANHCDGQLLTNRVSSRPLAS